MTGGGQARAIGCWEASGSGGSCLPCGGRPRPSGEGAHECACVALDPCTPSRDCCTPPHPSPPGQQDWEGGQAASCQLPGTAARSSSEAPPRSHALFLSTRRRGQPDVPHPLPGAGGVERPQPDLRLLHIWGGGLQRQRAVHHHLGPHQRIRRQDGGGGGSWELPLGCGCWYVRRWVWVWGGRGSSGCLGHRHISMGAADESGVRGWVVGGWKKNDQPCQEASSAG